MSKFKVGDRVRNINSNSLNYRKIGVITSVGLVNYVKYDYGNYGQGDDCYYELVEETPKKIAVQCDTIEEWKAVLDKLFSEGKRWIDGEKGYAEEYFKGMNKEYDCLSIEDGFVVNTKEYFKEYDYTIIPAKEYLGKDVNEKKTATQMMYEGQKTPLIIPSTPTLSQLVEMYQEALRHQDVLTGTIMSYSSGAGWSPQEVILSKEVNKKPNKIKQMTNELKNNIVDFAKNLSLSADEKVLREVGLKDSDGDWNTEALDISLDLEAVSLGFKSAEEMSNFVPAGCELSKLEVARLLKKYEVQLLEIAKKMKEESKKK